MKRNLISRSILIAGGVALLGTICLGVWFTTLQRQYRLNRQLVEALEKQDALQALQLVNAGADPNTPAHLPPPPSLEDLWSHLFQHSSAPKKPDLTAFQVACGAERQVDDGEKGDRDHN